MYNPVLTSTYVAMHGAVPGPCARYTRRTTNFTYYYNTSATDFDSAEQACMDNGGHLASFLSDQEQK